MVRNGGKGVNVNCERHLSVLTVVEFLREAFEIKTG